MPYNPEIHHRHSIRLKDYDYSQAGGYFVTLVTQQGESLFGEILNGLMELNEWGKIAEQEWFKTAELRLYVQLFADEFVVMPNHVHGIIWIGDRGDGDAQRGGRGAGEGRGDHDPINAKNKTPHVEAGSLGAIVRGYKSAVTYAINAARQSRGMVVWQRNYYEHIIRNDGELNRIRKYIAENPLRWVKDQLFRVR